MLATRLVTVCDIRRLPSALVLARSFLAHHGSASATVVVTDVEVLPETGPGDDRVRVLRGSDVGGDAFGREAATLGTDDLVDALVPRALAAEAAPVVWLAPDVEVTGPIELREGAGDLLVAAGGDEQVPCDDRFLARLTPGGDAALAWFAREQRRLGRGAALAQLVARFEEAGVLRGEPRFRAQDTAVPAVDGAAPIAAYDRAADGTVLDLRLRGLIARAYDEGIAASPFDPNGWAALRGWMTAVDPDRAAGGLTRFLYAVWRDRPDLQAAYPHLDVDADRDGFHGWAIVHGVPAGEVPAWAAPPEPAGLHDARAPEESALGVNVAGYFQSELGVGEAARRIVTALDTAQVPLLAVQGPTQPPSRRGHDAGSSSTESAVFPLNLVCVNADGLPQFAREAGPGFFAGRRTIGLWWWELPDFPPSLMKAFEHVDEVWVGSRYVQDAVSRVSPVPVLRMPLPVVAPHPPTRTREELGLPDGFLVLFLFDHNSVMERKNPIGLIEAFSRAFPEESGASLFIKSINADQHPAEHHRLLHAARERNDVHVHDGYVSADDRDAMIAACDVYASLHRAEGFGLTLAEAMALGRPVLATGWSGNVDFMSPDTSWLIPHAMTAVGPGNEPYDANSEWADPDLDAAAIAMREIRDDPVEATRRAMAGQRVIAEQHSPATAGRAMRDRLELVFPDAWAMASRLAEERAAVPREAVEVARRRAELGPEDFAARGAGRARSWLRSLTFRLSRPQVLNQQATDGAIVEALGQITDQLEALERRRAADERGAAHLAAGLLARQRVTQQRIDELSALMGAARTRDAALLRDLDGRVEELRASLDACAGELAPLTRAERAQPWVEGEPFSVSTHPVVGRVLGFADAPLVTPEERYRLFEDVFRGSRERVAGLLAAYVDLLEVHAPVLDVGAGRGELLELLRDGDIAARGVDLDPGMAAAATANGLDVLVADGVEHLESLDEDVLGAITAIHVIEHIPYDGLVRFLAAAHRALRPGGILVCETINPHAAFARKTFWVDLTHQHPIFPEVALVLARGAGFPSAFFGHLRGCRDVEVDLHQEDSYTLVATK